jgi:hypothetical protein
MSTTTSSGVSASTRARSCAVAGLPNDLEPGALEQAGQPFTQQDVVLGQDNPQVAHGRIVVVMLWIMV